MVRVELAGFNVDLGVLNEIKTILKSNTLPKEELENAIQFLNKLRTYHDMGELLFGGFPELSQGVILKARDLEEKRRNALGLLDRLTPETISASYARISRDPDDIPMLRQKAREDVEGSRKSNKLIIFGLGHKSIAEHATFNFDVMDLSRLVVEHVEKKRLCSYTEKSQRYVKMSGDFVMPQELAEAPHIAEPFRALVDVQNEFYRKNLDRITAWHIKQDYAALFDSLGCADKPQKQKEALEGLGKEDARYALSMATMAQFGLTISARNLESLITELRSSSLAEARELGEKMFSLVDGIAPSVIKYTKPTDYFQKTRPELAEQVKKVLAREVFRTESAQIEPDVILKSSLARDDSIVAGLIFSSTLLSFGRALYAARYLGVADKRRIIAAAEKYQERHDPKLREYELGDRVAQFTLSSSAFAQLKRHRMNTLIPQDYYPALGITTPVSIRETGLSEGFAGIIAQANSVYKLLKSVSPQIAGYALTNAHRRRVLFDANNRQVHAFCAERLNLPAQWDIRQIANQYAALIRAESPLTTAGLCGKDRFYEAKVQTMRVLEE